jgi:hypothetical protein
MSCRSRVLGLIALLVVVVAACDNFIGARVCDSSAIPAVTVEVRDSVSGQSAAAGATLLVVSGAYRDSVTYPDLADGRISISAAYERPGKYLVTVTKPGYAEWRTIAWAREGDCHVETVRFIARLQRL